MPEKGSSARRKRDLRRYLLVAVVAILICGLLSAVAAGAFAVAPHGHSRPSGSVTVPKSKQPAPGLKTVVSPNACPASDRRESEMGGSAKTSQAASYLLVPTKAVSMLVCRYNGTKNPPPIADPLAKAYGLVGQLKVSSAAVAESYVAGLNKIKARKNVGIFCPADFGTDLVVYFHYTHGKDYRYVIGVGGCTGISSGTVSRLGLGSKAISKLIAHTPQRPYGTVKGKLQMCGGPYPGTCHVENITDCGPECYTSNAVQLKDSSAKVVTSAKLHKGLFTAYAPPGTYELTVLATDKAGQHKTLSIDQSVSATVKAGYTTRSVLQVDVP